MAFSEHNRW